MAKIVLGKPPKTFKRNVSFVTIDGEEAIIECGFKYRTRSEYGQFFDSIMQDAKEEMPADGNISLEKILEKTANKNADYLLKILDSWNLDEELNRATLQQLSDEYPMAVTAILDSYRTAILEGRVGN